MGRPLQRLAELGQSVWIDYLSRELLAGGGLSRLIARDAVVGATSNPTIFEQAISHGGAYDAQLLELLPRQLSPNDLFLELACADVVNACDLLRPVWEGSEGRDGYVSIEVDPNVANDALAQFDQAKRLHERIDRPNLLVKIPATTPGVAAIEDSIADGRSINVTLIFSIDRYVAVARAYRDGLVRFRAAGGDVSTVHSVASFFVSRVDTEADKRLEAIGSKEALALRGKLAIANAKLAYEHYQQRFSGPRWEYLEGKGATPQRCLWASTSTKNPEYRDVIYVEELIGRDTVNTMPAETIKAFQDHGEVRGDTVAEKVDDAHKLFADIAKVGIDYDDVTETLELEGVQKFADSFAELLEGVRAKRGALAAA